MAKIDIEQHDVVPMAAKKVWNILRVLYFILRKKISRLKLLSDLNLSMKISRLKLLSDLNLSMKRSKISGKAISSLMTFSHQGHAATRNDHGRAASSTSSAAAGYEFSCSNSPAIGGYNYPQDYLHSHFFSSLHVGGKRHGNGRGNHFHGFFGCAHPPKTTGDDEAEAVASNVASFGFDDAAVMVMIEATEADRVSEIASPIPGFGRTPLARQLRITDSPFPLKDDGDGGKVDKAAEEFIQKFYRALQKQKSG